jgi:hypothetical protein
MLQIDETDMLEFFEQEPEVGEDGIWSCWRYEHQGIELVLSIWPYDEDVLISLRQVSPENELLDFKILGANRVRVFNDEKRPFVEVEYPAGSSSTGTQFTRVARLYVRPDLHVSITEN